jgi:hypothetical protein
MKKNILFLTLLISLASSAQKISLSKGQQITITSVLTQDIDMIGMGMQMKNDTRSTGIVEVNDTDKENFTSTYTLSKMNFNMDMMGQHNSYDSEKPEDKNSEMGKSFSEKIGKQVTVLINKKTGKATLEKTAIKPKANEEANPLDGLMNSFGSVGDDATVETIFFIIPAGKKMGDTWIDSSITKGMKELRTYTIKSMNGSLANIELFSKLEGNNSIESQGMQMDVVISAKTEGEILVDTKSSLVKKRSSVMDLSGSIEVMGQSVPITSKAIVNIDYN